MKPVLSLYILMVAFFSVACSEWFQSDNQRNQKGEQDSSIRTLSSEDSTVNEPVMVGGAFLICAVDTNGQTSNANPVGCRLENQNREKLKLTDIASDNLVASPSSGQNNVETIVFEVATDTSFWHWVTSMRSLDDVFVRLEKNFGFEIAIQEVKVLSYYPYRSGPEATCLGRFFGGACLHLSQAGADCTNTCGNYYGTAPTGFNLYHRQICRKILDLENTDPFRELVPNTLPLSVQICGYSLEPLRADLPAGRYVADIEDEVGAQIDDESILKPMVQVCSCVR